MSFRRYLESDLTFDNYKDKLPELVQKALSSPAVLADLESTGHIASKTLEGVLGVSGGLLSVIHSRIMDHAYSTPAYKKYEQKQLSQRVDDYLYHITPARKLAKIKKNGLWPNRDIGKGNFGGFYDSYSVGRLFFCEKGAIGYWKEKLETTTGITKYAVLRVAKKKFAGIHLFPDHAGTSDSRFPCFYVIVPIPVEDVEVVTT